MGTGYGTAQRLRWCMMVLCMALLGSAGVAQASTYSDLQSAGPGTEVALSNGATLTVGTPSTNGNVTTFSNSSVDFGAIAGTNVTGQLSGNTLTLTGGNFAVPGSLTTQAHTIDSKDPLTATFSNGAVTEFDGGLTSTSQPAAPAAKAMAAQSDPVDTDVNAALPVPAPSERYRFSLTLNGTVNPNSQFFNSWRFQVFLIRGGQEVGRIAEGTTFGNTVGGRSLWRYEIDISYPAIIQGRTVVIAGRLTGDNIFNPTTITGLSGSITGEIELTKGVFFTGGSISWDKSGFRMSGSARVNCAEGSVSGQLAGEYVDEKNWSLKLTAATTGCRVSKDLNLPSGNLTGEIKNVNGAVTGLFEVAGKLQTTLLPAGVNEWDGSVRFIYDGTDAGSYVAFSASAGIGSAQGRVNFDGTFALGAKFSIPFGGSSVAFDGDIKRTVAGGPVAYNLGGSATVALNAKTSVGGSFRLTNTTLSLAGHVEFACPVAGTAKAGVSGDIPLSSVRDWSLGLSAGAGSAGCQVTKEFGLAAGSQLSGQVKSTGGVLSVSANANGTINTTLIPTKTSFTGGFTFLASQGSYRVTVNGSTQGASFAADVASDGTFGLSFELSDLALGGVSLGAKGEIKRTTPGGAVAYSISGSLAGQVKLYDNLYFTGGSLGISSTGGLTFSGSLRQMCRSGYVDATASGAIVDGRNWSFRVTGRVGGGACVLSKDLTVAAGDLTGEVKAVNGAVTGLFEVGGRVQTTVLPAGVNDWDARFRFIYDGTEAGSYVAFSASAGIGSAQGRVNFDGTFALGAKFSIPFGGSSVAFDGEIKRTAPDGPVAYNLGGSATVAINAKTSVGGSFRLTNTTLSLAGQVEFACPVAGTAKAGVSGNIPLSSTRDWSLAISGGAGSAGCQVTKEIGLASGSALGGEVKSVGGVLSVSATANATVNLTLIPTKTSFTAGFTFFASRGEYRITVNASTEGASFAANVASDGTFGLSFRLDDLALGGVSLGARGEIKRTSPGANVEISVSGSLAGEVKIYDNLYFTGGSLSYSTRAGLQFSGSIRQTCTSGSIRAAVGGTITNSRNWSFAVSGVGSGCTIGRKITLDGQTLFASIASVDGKIRYTAHLRVARVNLFTTNVFLVGNVSTYLTNITAYISNECSGCVEEGKLRLSFGVTGNVTWPFLFWTKEASLTIRGTVDIRGTSVRKVDIGVGLDLGILDKQKKQLVADTEKGFTT